jgi:hypothetical protein
MKKKVLLVALLGLAMPLGMVACNKTATSSSTVTPSSEPTPVTSSQETVAAPVITEDKGVITWAAVSGATKYKVYINNKEGLEVTETTYTVTFQDAVEDKVTVAAITASGLESAKSNEKTVSFAAYKTDNVLWTKDEDAGFDDWKATSEDSEVLDQGYSLATGSSIAIVKEISEDTIHLLIEARDFEGQEPDGTTGAKYQVTINGEVAAPVGMKDNFVQLDPNASTVKPSVYDLSDYVGKTVVIRISEITGTSYRCCLKKIALTHFADRYTNGTVKKFYWGNKYGYKYDGESGTGFVYDYIVPGDDDNYQHESDWYFTDENVWDDIDFGEGAMLYREVSTSRLINITADTAYMTLDTRSFGTNYKGKVFVAGEALKPIGSDADYFTRDDYAGYIADPDDDCQNGVITRYDLTSYIGQTVMVTVANVSPEGNDYDKFVIGSIGFNNAWVYNGTDDLYWDAASLGRGNAYKNLEWDPAGVAFVYNEGMNFRTQDFASGIAKHIDLTKATTGKTITLTSTWRSFGGDDEATIEFWANGAKATTETYPANSDEDKDISIDMSSFAGQAVDVYARIPSRNYRIVLEHISLTVADPA